MHNALVPPFPWVIQHASLVRTGGRVLDLACGRGRHARWLAARGWQVDAVDRDAEAIESLRGVDGVLPLQADLEHGAWPYPGCLFDAIVVCRYLHRPLLSQLAESLAPGGVLIYETFMLGQEQFGRPSNPDFLLRPDELLQTYQGVLEIIAFEQGLESGDSPAMVQKLCARRRFVAGGMA